MSRLLNKIFGFYKDINPATLTGSIDVIIIQHEDDTYSCSPFHVRFGKIGVLHAREKVASCDDEGGVADVGVDKDVRKCDGVDKGACVSDGVVKGACEGSKMVVAVVSSKDVDTSKYALLRRSMETVSERPLM
uniref:Lipin N-terminal domain-containing protein n=1 Tax=Octopus bimaculoides TaxID=37653 RepID=A0A0L8I1L5_OCTBM